VSLFRFPGEIFLRVLQCLMIPLAMTSVVSAVGGQGCGSGASLALRTVAYSVLTTLFACVTGLVLVLLIKPGVNSPPLPAYPAARFRALGVDGVFDIISIPRRCSTPFLGVTTTKTRVMTPTGSGEAATTIAQERAIDGKDVSATTEAPVQEKQMHVNLTGLVAFSLLLGFALSRSESEDTRERNTLLCLTKVLSNKLMRMTSIVLWYSPIGICFLVVGDVLRVRDFSAVIWHLGLYAFTVLLGFGVHSLVFLPALYLVYVRRDAGRFFVNLLYPIVIAFGTSSSRIASPVTMATLERKIGLLPSTVRLVVPLGTILNRDGAAIYGIVATIYIAQKQGVQLGPGTLLFLVVACSLATLGLHGTHPELQGTAHLSLLLALVGLPSEDVGYISTLHWFLDRVSSCVNLLSDCIGVAVLQSRDEE
ncbi:unnamed protein product, partial [Ixodes hexagonus]